MAQASKKDSKAANTLFVIGSIVATAAAGTFLGYLVGLYAVAQLTGPGSLPRVDSITVTGDKLLQNPAAVNAKASVPEAESRQPVSESEVKSAQPAVKSSEPSRPSNPSILYRVQVGAFSVRDNAQSLAERLQKEEELPAVIAGSGPYRVQVGAFGERTNADNLAVKLKDKGYPVLVVETSR